MKIDLIDRNKYRKDLLSAYDDVSMEFDVLDRQPSVVVIPLDKVRQAREEIRKLDDINPDYPMDRTIHVSRNEVLEILNKLIESEDYE